ASRLESAVASGARVAAQAGDDPQADWEVLQAMRGALGPDISDVERVVVYEATTADGTVPAACLTASALVTGGVAGVCSVYGSDDLASLSHATFTSGGAHNGGAGNPCGGGSTAGWCPADRVDPSGAAVMLGVYAVMHRSSITGYLPTLGSDIDERAVARIEPAS
ncbi:MAG: hypothetical protein KDB21_14625, partial [Acidimicrobiales bacterium]|nr:hypothetical protein [Acidimicrobiales bacterium]